MRLRFLALLVAATAIPAAAEVIVAGSPAIDLPASASAGSVTVRVKTSETGTVSLSAGRMTSKTTKEVLPYAAAIDPAAFAGKAGEVREVSIAVTGILFEGEAELELMDGGERIGTISVSRAPFAVSAAQEDVVFQHGYTPSAITLRNDGRSPYRVRWMMQLGVTKQCGTGNCETDNGWAAVTIPPKDSASISVAPPNEWFDCTFCEETREATLWLTLGDGLPKRAIPLKAHLRGWYYPGRNWWTLSLLAAGALFSLVVRHWVPNLQRKRELKAMLRRIRMKIDGFSHDISPDLRVSVNVEWNLLDGERKSVWTIMPDYVTLATQITQKGAVLERRVDLIEEMDGVYQTLREEWDKCPPPTQNDEIEDLLREASERLKKTQCSETELLSIRQVVERARGLVARMRTPDEAFGNELAARRKLIREELARYRPGPLAAELPGLFQAPANADEPIPVLRYALADYEIQALSICRDYLWLIADAVDAERKGELEAMRPVLVHHLVRKGWNDLRLARLLLKQFRENCREEEVWTAVNAAEAEMYIVREPQAVRFSEIVEFRVLFRRQDMNWSAARDQITPEWDFGDGNKRQGWVVSHYFLDTRKWRESLWDWCLRRFIPERFAWKERSIWVSFTRMTDGRIEKKDMALREVVKPEVDSTDDRNTRTFHEAIGLAVSIAVPLLSLLAGAEKAISEDPAQGALTVFLLGYSSESILSVFRQRVSPAQN